MKLDRLHCNVDVDRCVCHRIHFVPLSVTYMLFSYCFHKNYNEEKIVKLLLRLAGSAVSFDNIKLNNLNFK